MKKELKKGMGFDGFGYDIYRAMLEGNIFERIFHRRRLAFWLSAGDFEGKKVLDVGCNTGIILLPLLERGVDALGIDVSAEEVAMAKENLKAKGFSPGRVRLADASNLPFRAGSFDVVILADVLEHVSKPSLVASEVLRVVRAGGMVLASVPNERHPVVRYSWVRRLFTGRSDVDKYRDVPYNMKKMASLFGGAKLLRKASFAFGTALFGAFRKDN